MKKQMKLTDYFDHLKNSFYFIFDFPSPGPDFELINRLKFQGRRLRNHRMKVRLPLTEELHKQILFYIDSIRESSIPINELKRNIEITIKVDDAFLTSFEPVLHTINGKRNADLEIISDEISVVDVKILENS